MQDSYRAPEREAGSEEEVSAKENPRDKGLAWGEIPTACPTLSGIIQ